MPLAKTTTTTPPPQDPSPVPARSLAIGEMKWIRLGFWGVKGKGEETRMPLPSLLWGTGWVLDDTSWGREHRSSNRHAWGCGELRLGSAVFVLSVECPAAISQ